MKTGADSGWDSAIPLMLLLAGFAINLAAAVYLLWGPPHDKGVAAALAFTGYMYLHVVLNSKACVTAKGYRAALPAWVTRGILALALTSAKKEGMDRDQEWPSDDAAAPVWFVVSLIAISYVIYLLTMVYAAVSPQRSETLAMAPTAAAAVLTTGLLVACCRELVACRRRALADAGAADASG